jgi:quercetin dioxygenase-like cupin family protein
MHSHLGLKLAFLIFSVLGTRTTEMIHNDKVWVVEQTLSPGEILVLPVDRPSVLVYLDSSSLAVAPARGRAVPGSVHRGDTVFEPPQAGSVQNTGSSALRVVRVEYLGKGNGESWGAAGLAPNYKVLFENRYGRVYDIRIAAGATEPQHTHHDRVVVCLSGAVLEHILPNGRKENSSLNTDEVVWRRGATHVGHNLGKTDLWVIAIEPK